MKRNDYLSGQTQDHLGEIELDRPYDTRYFPKKWGSTITRIPSPEKTQTVPLPKYDISKDLLTDSHSSEEFTLPSEFPEKKVSQKQPENRYPQTPAPQQNPQYPISSIHPFFAPLVAPFELIRPSGSNGEISGAKDF